jgi:hypothetical protein
MPMTLRKSLIMVAVLLKKKTKSAQYLWWHRHAATVP